MAFFKLTFHSPVSKESRCSLCSELMRDAVYTTCCDSFFCQECITRVHSIKRPCPKCNGVKFDIIKDNKARAMRTKINALCVYCPMSKNGCKWIGPLEGLDHHLKYGDTTISSGSGSCQFLTVECPNKCGDHIPRGDLPKHLRDRCSQRQLSCPHCGFTDTHDHVTTIHYSTCTLYPVDCPNGCKMPKVSRKEVKDHVENECPLRTVSCGFEFAGCPSEFKHTNEYRHMEERTTYHLSLLSTYCLKLSAENEELRGICYQLQETCASLQSDLGLQKSTLKQTQLELWSIKLKLPQPLPIDEGEEFSPPLHFTQIPPKEHRDRIYSEPNTFTVTGYAQGRQDGGSIEHGKRSLPSRETSSLDHGTAANLYASLIPRHSSVPSLHNLSHPGYDKPHVRHQSSPPMTRKPVKPVSSLPIPEVFEPTSPSPVELMGTRNKAPKPAKPVKPGVLPRRVARPPVPQRPVSYANLGVAKRKVSNGVTNANMNELGSSSTLSEDLSNELRDVFSVAETPVASGNEESKTENS